MVQYVSAYIFMNFSLNDLLRRFKINCTEFLCFLSSLRQPEIDVNIDRSLFSEYFSR